MRKLLVFLLLVLFVSIVSSCGGSGLPTFGAEMGVQANPVPGQDSIRIAYSDMISYYGYVKPGAAPDETRDGKKFYYLYVWIPLVAPEIGIRMISPVFKGMEPAKGDFVSPLYPENKADVENYFDTWISWERALEVINPEDIATKAKTTKWLLFDQNDDSSELPAQPSGSKYNSVLRIVSSPSDPLKSLIRGLYRIGFTTYKVGEVKGSFLAQVGAPIKIPGVAISASIDEVSAAATAK